MYHLGENLANRRLDATKKNQKIQKIQKNWKKRKSVIDENLANRHHGSKKMRSTKMVQTWQIGASCEHNALSIAAPLGSVQLLSLLSAVPSSSRCSCIHSAICETLLVVPWIETDSFLQALFLPRGHFSLVFRVLLASSPVFFTAADYRCLTV